MIYQTRDNYNMAIQTLLIQGWVIDKYNDKKTKLVKDGEVQYVELVSDEGYWLPFALGFFLNLIGVLFSGLLLKKYEKRWSASLCGLVWGLSIVGIMFFLIIMMVTHKH